MNKFIFINVNWGILQLYFEGLNLTDFWVLLILHTHGVAPTFLKINMWSPGAGFISIIYTKGINHIKKGKL